MKNRYVIVRANEYFGDDDNNPIHFPSISAAEKAIKEDAERDLEAMEFDIHDDQENLFDIYSILQVVKEVKPFVEIKTKISLA